VNFTACPVDDLRRRAKNTPIDSTSRAGNHALATSDRADETIILNITSPACGEQSTPPIPHRQRWTFFPICAGYQPSLECRPSFPDARADVDEAGHQRGAGRDMGAAPDVAPGTARNAASANSPFAHPANFEGSCPTSERRRDRRRSLPSGSA
jgi:hypothetical protein